MIVTSTTPPAIGRRAVGVGCDLVARAILRATADEVVALRKSPGTLGGRAIAPGTLKHADEQAVVGLAAVLRAVETGGVDPDGFGGWGVVASPSALGRSAFDAAFPQFLAEGAWGVSPLLISSHSLHSVSGVVSQALKAHGPNLGVGGAAGVEEQAMLAAAVMLAERSAPGVWVVFTGWDGPDGSSGTCEGLALALTAPRSGWAGTRLVIAPGAIRDEPTNWRADAGHDHGLSTHLITAAQTIGGAHGD